MSGLTALQWQHLNLLLRARGELFAAQQNNITQSYLCNVDNIAEELEDIDFKIDDLDPAGCYAPFCSGPSTTNDTFSYFFLLQHFEKPYTDNLHHLHQHSQDNCTEQRLQQPPPESIATQPILNLVKDYHAALKDHLLDHKNTEKAKQYAEAAKKLAEVIKVPDLKYPNSVYNEISSEKGLMVGLDAKTKVMLQKALETYPGVIKKLLNLHKTSGIAATYKGMKKSELRKKQQQLAYQRARKALIDANINFANANKYNKSRSVNSTAELETAEYTALRIASCEFVKLHNELYGARPFRMNGEISITWHDDSLRLAYLKLRNKFIQKTGDYTSFRIATAEVAANDVRRIYPYKRVLFYAPIPPIQLSNGTQIPGFPTPESPIPITDADIYASIKEAYIHYLGAWLDTKKTDKDLVELRTEAERFGIQIPDWNINNIKQLVDLGVAIEQEFENKLKPTPEELRQKVQQWDLVMNFAAIKFGPGALAAEFKFQYDNWPTTRPPNRAFLNALGLVIGLACIAGAVALAVTSFGIGVPLAVVIIKACMVTLMGGFGCFATVNNCLGFRDRAKQLKEYRQYQTLSKFQPEAKPATVTASATEKHPDLGPTIPALKNAR